MSEDAMLLDEIARLTARLTVVGKIRLVERVMNTLETDLTPSSANTFDEIYGMCHDLGTAPSDDDIDTVRREIWANFPREDV